MLRYSDEIKEGRSLFRARAGEKFHNHYVDAVNELVKEKVKGKAIVKVEEPVPVRGTA